jgi:hypothetical protein
MGYFGQWLVAKGVDARGLRRLGLKPTGEGAAPGWQFADVDDPNRLAELVAKASEAGGAAVGAAVFDSDFAYVVAARDGVQAAEVAVNQETAREYEVDLSSDPEAFARWTEVAPRTLSADEVRAVLRQDWVFAEQGVQELLEQAGLPEPYDPSERHEHPRAPKLPPRTTTESVGATGFGGYEGPLGWMWDAYPVAREDLPWVDARYVPGIGADFLGIWDRKHPSEPAFRFMRTPRGEARLREELDRLREPLELERLGLAGFGGFLRPLDSGTTFRLIQRELPIREARFVAGHGDGYVGVWDREHPAEPIERFGEDHDEELRAREHVHRLLFDHELARKKLSGGRLVHPRQAQRLEHHTWDVLADVPGFEQVRSRLSEVQAQGYYSAAVATGPWLVTEEEPDERWQPTTPVRGGRFHLYLFDSEQPLETVRCQGSFASVEEAQEAAQRDGAEGGWIDVPATVPRDLLSTVRWVEAELEAEAWYERFEPVEGDPELAGDRAFVRLFHPETGELDAVLVFARGGEGHDAATYLVRAFGEPRLVYALDDPDALISLLPNYLHERRFGEWRALAEGVPRELQATAEWASFAAGLT